MPGKLKVIERKQQPREGELEMAGQVSFLLRVFSVFLSSMSELKSGEQADSRGVWLKVK